MKKSALTLFIALAVSPLLIQCASQDELNQIHYQLRMLNKKVTDLESSTIDSLQKRQASSSSQMDQLHQEFLQLKGDLEESGHLNRRLKEQNKELENTFKNYTRMEEEKRATEQKRIAQKTLEKDRQLESLTHQLKIQQENVQAIQQARVDEAKRKAIAAAQAAKIARQKAEAANRSAAGSTITRIRADKRKKLYSSNNAAPAPERTLTTESKPNVKQAAPTKSSTAVVSSGDGNSLYNQGKYRKAYQAFEEVTRSQKGSEAINARFMMGESLFALEEYDQAILDYQNIITNNPSSPKAPAAMLRQGMAFENLDDKDTAKILYKKLLASYKKSPEASQAQQRLDKL